MKTVVTQKREASADVYNYIVVGDSLGQTLVYEYDSTIPVTFGGTDGAGNVTLYADESLPINTEIRNLLDINGKQVVIENSALSTRLKVINVQPMVDIFGLVIGYKITLALRA